MTGDNKVTITGTNGVPTGFVIGVPQLSFAPAIALQYDALGMGANDLCAVGFSGNYLLAGNYTSTAKTPIYFDFSGNKVGQLEASRSASVNSRTMASASLLPTARAQSSHSHSD